MNVFESVRVAIRGLAANKMRSILTMLGIIIGVAAVIALMSIGDGVQASITQQIQSIGSNLIIISPGSANSGVVKSAAGTAATLTYEDALALEDPDLAPAVAGVSPEFGSAGQIVYGNQNFNLRITGVTPEYETVRNVKLANGSFFMKSHLDARSRVAILGATTAKNLFAGDDAIDREIKINRQPFTVIGVLEAKGGSPMLGGDDVVLIPITTAQRRLFNAQVGFGVGNRVASIYVSAVDETQVDVAIQQISEILRVRHKTVSSNDDFTVTSQKDILGLMDQVTGLMTAFLGAIAAISLVVGGIGIMNIMLVSVTERTREIGIRKAVGAKWRDILLQFLVEAVVLSILGGIGGITLGWSIGQVVNALKIGAPQPPLVTIMTAQSVAMAVSFSIGVGLFFGIYPATRAASLNPIDALRYE
jgi:putative ABC transport system permease protein